MEVNAFATLLLQSTAVVILVSLLANMAGYWFVKLAMRNTEARLAELAHMSMIEGRKYQRSSQRFWEKQEQFWRDHEGFVERSEKRWADHELLMRMILERTDRPGPSQA